MPPATSTPESEASKPPFYMPPATSTPESEASKPTPESEAPRLLLGPGKFRNRDEKGRFAKGVVEGNYVPKQAGVEANAPQLVLINGTLNKIQTDLEDFHKEDKQLSDAQLDEIEENRIKNAGGPKLLGMGNKDSGGNKELMKKGDSGLAIGSLLSKAQGLITAAPGALAKGGGALIEGVDAMAGTLGTMGAGLGTAAIAGAATIASYKIAQKASKGLLGLFGIDPDQDKNLEIEALRDNNIVIDDPWWLPEPIWNSRVLKADEALQNKLGVDWKKKWLKQKHHDIFKKAYPNEKDEIPKTSLDISNEKSQTLPDESIPASTDITPPGSWDKRNLRVPAQVPGAAIAPPILANNASGDNPPTRPQISHDSIIPPQVTQAPKLVTSSKMTLSEAGLSKLKKNEGLRKKAYPDAGHMSIGYGHQIKPGENYTEIDEKTATDLLRQDVSSAEAAVNSVVKVPISQEMFDALTDFTYNTGWQGNKRPIDNIAATLNSGDYKGAGNRMKLYNKSRNAGKLEVNPSLNTRRNDEDMAFNNSDVALSPKQPPTQGKSILDGNKQIEDSKAANSANNSGTGNTIVAPTNNTQISNSIIAQQHDPRNTDNTYKDARYRDSFAS
jgi:lysozyme